MADPILVVDYRFAAGAIANPDASLPATQVGCTQTAGPGPTAFGALASALHFSGGARVTANPAPVLFDPRRFCIRLMLRVTSPVNDRANVFEAALPACSVHLMPPAGTGQFRVVATIDNKRNGWSAVDTAARRTLQLNSWYTLETAYDQDTLALFVNGSMVGVTAFPDGVPAARTSAELILGVHPDLIRWPFAGDIAMLQIWNGVPPDLQKALDDARGNPEWHLRLKENTLLPAFPLSPRQGDIVHDPDSTMHLQRYDGATMGYGTGMPAAYLMVGAIRERWERALLGGLLGALVSDEADTRASGGRRNVFERGAIYWSADTGAWEVHDRPYIDYEQLGGSVSVLGLPVAAPEALPGGTVQRFQHGRLYHRTGATRAYEVHGAILDRYLATGGPGTWGYPVSDEEDVLLVGTGLLAPPPTGAKQSRFERCTFFWSAATGAHEVHGAIRDAYLAAGGPGLPNDDQFNGLGLPTSDETDFPAWAGFGRYNTFEHGAIAWNGAATRVCPAFRIKLGLVQTKEDEGLGQGQNDLFFRISLTRNGTPFFNARVPDEDAFDGDNSHDLDYVINRLIVPNQPEMRIGLSVEVWDEDGGFGGKDQKLGTLTKDLNIGNAWGLFDNEDGVFLAAGISKITRFEWQVQPRQPPKAAKDFWETGNLSTPNITYAQYAAAFTDIDDDPEWTDPSDWAQREVFARRVKSAAAGGNCFGFCTEALYAWFGRGYGLPLARFAAGDWPGIRNTVNVKQIYWFGSDVLSHVHDQKEDDTPPSAIFQETRDRFLANDPCMISMWSNADYTGTAHSVLPFAWDDSTVPWTIQAFDPNGRNTPAQIRINPFSNTFSFNNAGLALSGAMLFTPWSAVDHRQCSPAWDPNLLLLAMLIVVVGADATTVGMSDTAGDNLWMPHNPRTERLSGRGQFSPVSVPDGSLDGEILVRKVRRAPPGQTGIGDLLDLTMIELKTWSQAAIRGDERALNPLPLPPRWARILAGMDVAPSLARLTLRELMLDANAVIAGNADGAAEKPTRANAASMRKEVLALQDWLGRQSSRYGPDFIHHMQGKRRGRFDYLARWRLTETRMRCLLDGGEKHRIEASGLAGRMPLYQLTAQREKLVTVEHTVRLGRNADFARIKIGQLPIRSGLPLNVAIRGGIAGVDVLTAGERVEAPVELETWRAGSRTVSRFTVPFEGGLRLMPALHEPGASLNAAKIETMFGGSTASQLLKPI